MKNLFRRTIMAMSAFAFALMAGAQSQSLADGLVASYNFNGNANDLSGNGNHGIVVTQDGYPRLATDRHGISNGAYEFGGYDYRDSYIRVPNSSSLQFTDAMSISMWIMIPSVGGENGWGNYSESAAGFTAIAKAGDGHATEPGFYVNVNIGKDIEGVRIDGQNTNGDGHDHSNVTTAFCGYDTSYKCGDWLHFALVVEDYRARLYINGVLMNDSVADRLDFDKANQEDLYFGIMYPWWFPFKGRIDDVRIYNRALMSSEVYQLYDNNSVNEKNIPVESITLGETPERIVVGQTAQLSATVSPANATTQRIEWKQNDEVVATVSKSGLVTAMKPGLVTIRAKATDGTAITTKCTIEVAEESPEIEATLRAYKGFNGLTSMIQMSKVTADGSAQLMLDIPLIAQKLSLDKGLYLEVWDMDGKQKIDATAGETGTIALHDGKFYVYTAPKDFCQNVKSEYYQVHICGYDKSLNAKHLATARIYRPGLLLIHGLLSSGKKAFPDFANFLSNTYYGNKLLLVDYKSTNTSSFEFNTKYVKVVKNASETMYKNLWDKGILSSSYDLVGHSMGGILSRLYVQDDEETDEDKKAKNHVHKIITVNTPHWGSSYGEIGNYVEDKLDDLNSLNDAVADALTDNNIVLRNTIKWTKEMLAECSLRAISNLAPGSKAIINLGDKDKIKELYNIPCHSVCSYIEIPSDNVVNNNYDNEGDMPTSDCQATLLNNFLAGAEVNQINEWLGEDKHDGVVPLHSQMGRKDENSDYVTPEKEIFYGAFINKSNAFHCKTTSWDKTQNKLLDLLTASVDDKRFCKSGFESQSGSNEARRRTPGEIESPIIKPAESDSTYIKMSATQSVENDSVFLYLNVEHSADITDNIVMSSINEESALMATGKDSYRFLIPSTFSGELAFYGMGRTKDFQLVADTMHINIEGISSIVSLSFDDEDIVMTTGQSSQHYVKALWDNQQVTVVDPELSSTNENVACIEDGLVKAVGPGVCQLIAKYGDYQCRVNVEVSNMDEGLPEAIADITADDCDFRLYNAGNVLHIVSDKTEGDIYNVTLYDISGTERGSYCVASDSNTATVSLNTEKNHVYIVKVTSGSQAKTYRFRY